MAQQVRESKCGRIDFSKIDLPLVETTRSRNASSILIGATQLVLCWCLVLQDFTYAPCIHPSNLVKGPMAHGEPHEIQKLETVFASNGGMELVHLASVRTSFPNGIFG